MSATAAVLPVKRFELAKQRLGATLDAPPRRELAAAMVADVLDALAATPGLAATIVVSAEPSVLTGAARTGAQVVSDTAQSGQSPAATLGIEHARRAGFDRVLLVPGDCPALDPGELAGVLGRPESVVIVPDRHRTGTNGLLLDPPTAIAPAFGPGSMARHRAAALAAGVSWTLAEPPTLMLDVDTGEDLRALRDALRAHPGGARRTRAVLDRIAGERPAA